MKKIAFLFFLAASISLVNAAEPLRVFLRGGKKSHGPGAHEHEQFLNDWTKLLTDRGMKVTGAMTFPTDEQLAGADVLLMYAQDGGTVPENRREGLNQFLKRGGGIVVIHTASVSADTGHWKSIIGGAWVNNGTKWLEGPMSLYYADGDHPITRTASNFDLDDEIYYDMDLSPDIHILASAYTPKTTTGRNARNANQSTAAGRRASVFDIQPQMWTYERTIEGGRPYRAFVSIPGHLYVNFGRPNYRAVLLRGIAWTARRSNVDEFCTAEELSSLRYPEGGPTAPDKASVKLEIHPDFNMSLVAAEPLITKPININWDPQGRLWVAETPEYPNGRKQPNVEPWKDSGSLVRSGSITNRPATDRISILIDSNGDGRPDKKEVFYEGLELVTSFVFHKDGIIASAAPDIWMIYDTDGDGKADKVEKLYTGLGIGDTHAVINNLRWGFDGWIYATHGYSATEHVWSGDRKTDFGRVGSGVVRFKPDGTAFEQYCSKGGNTWGLDISWDNEVFFTQPTSGDLLNHVVLPEYILARGQVAGARSFKPQIVRQKSFPLISYDKLPYVQIDLVGSFTASAGCAIYDGGSWPSEWNYSYFTTEPTINLIHHEVVKPDGVSYTASKVREPEFIAGRDMWFRPIETRIGPDGALYICDFYNQAVVHNDTRGPRHGPANAAVRPDRDHYFGRIWRVDHKQSRRLDIPNLATATAGELVKALDHPNAHVRQTAQRLITEKGAGMPAAEFFKTFSAAGAGNSSVRWNIHWNWILANLNLQRPEAPAGLRENPEFLKNSIRVLMAMANRSPGAREQADATPLLLPNINHANARVSLDAILALTSYASDQRVVSALLALYPNLDDSWRQSAVIGVAMRAPDQYLAGAFASATPAGLRTFVSTVCSEAVARGNEAQVTGIIRAIANGPEASDAIRQIALENVARGLTITTSPKWSPELQASLQKLLRSGNTIIPAAALPLVARLDKQGALTGDVKSLVTRLIGSLSDSTLSDTQRANAVASLLPARQMNPEILPAVAKLLAPSVSSDLQRRVVEALGATGDSAVGLALAGAYARLDATVRSVVLAQLLKRADWSLAFLDILDSGAANVNEIGPADFYRLRTHPDVKVANRATELWNKARGGAVLEKTALIAKYTPMVTQSGDVKKGKELFTVNCANCHKLDNLGNEVGPVLTGMGAHGPAELLVHILDPNREVEPSYVAVNIETKDDEAYDGVVVRENRSMVAIRNASGEKEIPLAQIKTRRSSGRSLMPEGFEALGGDGLRDLLAFVCAGENRFRFIELSSAFTADSRRGIYTSTEALYDTLKFRKFGAVTVSGVPFNIVDPARSANGKNLVVLKGGASRSYSRTLPQRVEAHLGFAASKLHFLGGVAGWGYPGGGEDTPVMRVTAQYADGQKEEMVMKNGQEFADFIRVVDVPGSDLVEGVVNGNQVRYYSKPLKGKGTIEKLVIESFDNGVAPTTVAITAELAGASGGAEPAAQAGSTSLDTAKSAAPFSWTEGTRVLLVGGGSSHEFNRFFNIADKATLQEGGRFSVNYTESPEVFARELPEVKVAVLSVNKERFDTDAVRKALFAHVDAGKGLVLLHPGVWYNWREWPEYNRVIAGGGSRGHDKIAEFVVEITDREHPLTKGLPASFKITDELYWFEPDTKGTPIKALATTHSPSKRKEFPMIWVVEHPKARIAAIAPGHDARAHDLPEFKQLLRNAVTWAAGN